MFTIPERLDRLQDHVSVSGGVAGADETDGMGDKCFEIVVWQAVDFDIGVETLETVEGCIEGFDHLAGVRRQKFLGLPNPADFEVMVQQIEQIGYRGDPTAEAEVHGFNFIPVRKCPVGNHDCVGMADAGKQVEDVRVENSLLEHEYERLG